MTYTDDDVAEQPTQAEKTESGKKNIEVEASPMALPEQEKGTESTKDSSASNAEQSVAQQRADVSQPKAADDQTATSTAASSARSNCGTLDLRINDWHGHPIANLEFKVIQEKAIAFQGKSDANGKIATITGLRINRTFEIHVKKDSGEYKFAALGKLYGEESYACLQSPKTRFEFSTEPHQGAPGIAEQKKEKTIQSHNQAPAAKPEITGNPDKKPAVETGRDKNGNPKVSVVDGLRNWYNQNANNTGAPAGGVTDVERVQKLIDFAYRQAEWRYQDGITTDAYIKKMHDKTFVDPPRKARTDITHLCNKYVKIALWYAYHEGTDIKPIGAGIVPAKDMGPALIKAGFLDITDQIPDARWAAPGDIIVYQNKKNPSAAGHIDIRTYDGYVSDFFTERLPVSGFKVIGIYRKCYDPMPEKRMRAFLKVVREWECHEEVDDEKRYFLLQRPIDGSRRFTSTGTHPYAGREKTGTFAGAYQIRLETWEDALKRGDITADFSPKTQDRIAVWKCEARNNALGLIRLGKIEEAVRLLTSEWTSLPGGVHNRKGKSGNKNYVYTIEEVLKAFKVFLDEQK